MRGAWRCGLWTPRTSGITKNEKRKTKNAPVPSWGRKALDPSAVPPAIRRVCDPALSAVSDGSAVAGAPVPVYPYWLFGVGPATFGGLVSREALSLWPSRLLSAHVAYSSGAGLFGCAGLYGRREMRGLSHLRHLVGISICWQNLEEGFQPVAREPSRFAHGQRRDPMAAEITSRMSIYCRFTCHLLRCARRGKIPAATRPIHAGLRSCSRRHYRAWLSVTPTVALGPCPGLSCQ
jgi:hypothetical protein